MLGWHAIAREYHSRYFRPMMLTETNRDDQGHGEAVTWMKQTWSQAHHLRHRGVPVIGYTWFSLTDQIDWNIQIARIEGTVNPNGLCTLDRKLRPAGELFKRLAHDHADSPLLYGVPTGLMTH